MIINANALHLPLADETVQCVVTSPPYWGLRDYSVSGQLGLEPTPEEYVANMVAVFREVRRVLRPDGVCWLNLGDSYAANRRGGGSDFGGLRGMRGPNDKPGENYSGTSPDVNIPPGLKPKDLVGIPWRVAFALQADGWWLRSDIIWSKPNPMPESVTDRPTKAHEYIFLLTKAANYYYDAEAVREDGPTYVRKAGGYTRQDINGEFKTRGGFARQDTVTTGRNRRTVWTIPTSPYSGSHFATFPPDLVRPCILAGSSPRACEHCGAPWERVVEKDIAYPDKARGRGVNTDRNDGGKACNADRIITTTGWQATCKCDNAGTGRSIVLDPFAGTFTVGMVAAEYGRRAVGIELSPEYIKLAQERTAQAMAQQVMPL